MTFEIHKKNNLYYFQAVSGNGRILMSSQDYKAKQSAQRGISSVKKNIVLRQRFYLHSKRNGQTYFHLKAGNGEIIADSQLYPDEGSLESSIKSLMSSLPKAHISDLTT